MSSQPTIPVSAPPPELHPNDLANMPPGISMQNVPAFEQPTAQTTKLSSGTSDDSDLPSGQITVAHAAYGDYDNKGKNKTVFVDSPRDMTQPILNHEILHLIQEDQSRRSYEARVDPDKYARATDVSVYDYGGVEGLENRLRQGKSLSDLSNEQQAKVLQDYTEEMGKFGLAKDPDSVKFRNSKNQAEREVQLAMDIGNAKRHTPEVADRLNKAYGPFIRQMAEMARKPNENTINTTPAPPGPPPAALTGAVKPLPEIGGRTIELHANDLANHPGRKK